MTFVVAGRNAKTEYVLLGGMVGITKSEAIL
jgi:hypothetical protein